MTEEKNNKMTRQELLIEIEELREQLREVSETLDAIRRGEVDAIVVAGTLGNQIYTLSGAERPYRMLIEQMGEGAITLSADNTILYGNKKFAELLKTPPEKIIGSNIFNYVNQSDHAIMQTLLFQKTSGNTRSEIVLKAADDSLISAYVSSGMVTFDNTAILCLIVTDLTEQKRNEDIVKSERLLRLVFEQAGEPIIVCDKQGKVIRSSRAAHTLCGKDILYQPFDSVFSLQFNPENTPERKNKQYFSVLDTFIDNTIHNNTEVVFRRDDGTTFFLILNFRPLSNGENTIAGGVVSLTDISGIKKAEEEKAMLRERLYQLQKFESAAVFAGGIAHNFNNILQIITGYSSLLKNTLKDKESLDFIQSILKSTERASDLTKRILVFTGKHPGSRKIMCLNEVIKDVEGLLMGIVSTRVRFETVLTNKDCTVVVDQKQIEELLINLAKNARDAMPEGGFLKIQTDVVEMDTSFINAHNFGKPGRYALISVSDTGIGMDKEIQAHLFEPFFTTKGLATNTGLGLSTVYGIVKQHDGYIDVDSTPGTGTMFKVYLPVVETEW